jgi:carboxylate-amine ligase
MAFYKTNQRRVPEIAGDVVPEYMTSFAQYRRDVFEPIYRALDQLPGAERIRNEFVNSRGAIPRFVRDALEVRVVDLQECVKMDVAVAGFVRLAAKGLWRLLDAGHLRLPEHAMLVEDYEACVAQGRAARVEASHLCAAVGYRPGAATATTALHELLDLAWGESQGADQPYLRLVEERIRTGSLAELVLRATALDRRSEGEGRAAIERVYGELADCLLRNQPWQP